MIYKVVVPSPGLIQVGTFLATSYFEEVKAVTDSHFPTSKSTIRKPWRCGLVVSLVASLFFSSGCALLLLGAGAAGGYLIKKGEEGESPKNSRSPNLEQRSSAKRVEQKAASSSEGKGGQQLAQIQQAQERLKARGFDPGAIDGILGPQTRAALNEYQAAQRLPTTGVLDEKTRKSLGVR
ncbi:MAG: peptidoglycan-binding domain-containing protein [Planctomycetota bacterium]